MASPSPLPQPASRAGMTSLPEYFAGLWRLDRRIVDRRIGATGRLVGTLRAEPRDGGLRIEETGWLRFGAHGGPARRVMLWRFPGAGRIAVADESSGPLLDLAVAAGVAEGCHACGGDLYRLRLRLIDRSAWRAIWRVTGPRKDYWLATQHRRLATLRPTGPGSNDPTAVIASSGPTW